MPIPIRQRPDYGTQPDIRSEPAASGNYQVSAEAPGFRVTVRRGVVLTVASRVEINFTLEVGAVTDTVTVTAEARCWILRRHPQGAWWITGHRPSCRCPRPMSHCLRDGPGVQSNGEVRVIGPGDQSSTFGLQSGRHVGTTNGGGRAPIQAAAAGRLVRVHSDEISEIRSRPQVSTPLSPYHRDRGGHLCRNPAPTNS